MQSSPFEMAVTPKSCIDTRPSFRYLNPHRGTVGCGSDLPLATPTDNDKFASRDRSNCRENKRRTTHRTIDAVPSLYCLA